MTARGSRVAVAAAMFAMAMLATLVLSACSAEPAQPAAPFTPEGNPGSAVADQTTGAAVSATTPVGHLVMPPFGRDAHVIMTGYRPKNSSWAAAVIIDKDFELAYLYSEYTSGENQDWRRYVGATLETELASALSAPGVTQESFNGTIRYFDMTAFTDPTVPSYLDVAMCFDNAKSSNTSKRTGKVIPDTTPAADHYYRLTDELERSAGLWQVVAEYPAVYYPRAKECKP